MLFYLSVNFLFQGFIIKNISPVYDDVEGYERDDGGPDVQDGVHPKQVNTQVPEIAPESRFKINMM